MRWRDLRGRLYDRWASWTAVIERAGTEAEQVARAEAERRQKIRAAARLDARCRKLRGAGWFPGDGEP